MEVSHNGESMQIQLEAEKVLGEVITGILQWLTEHRRRLFSLSVDGEAVDWTTAGSWQQRPLDVVRAIAITSETVAESVVRRLGTVCEYLELVRDTLTALTEVPGDRSQPAIDALADALGELAYVDAFLRQSFAGWREALNHWQATATSLQSLAASGNGTSPTDSYQLTLGQVAGAIGFVHETIRELRDPKAELAAAVHALAAVNHAVAEIAVLFQTGSEREAVRQVNRFLALIEKSIRTVALVPPTMIDEPALRTVTQSLQDVLSRLADAFASTDTVMIADLLEYELSPMVAELVTLLGSSPDPTPTASDDEP